MEGAGSSSMTGQSCKKRARDSEPAVPLRHEQLWFDDGNIVLVAENVAFKVHRSLLRRHSQVFSDLFQLSQPSQEDEMDGVPVCTLHDSHHELADILDVIYSGARYFKRDTSKPSFALIQSLLRLGTKYEMEDLRSEALHYLELCLPNDIRAWDKFSIDPPVQYEQADLISMVNLTRELGFDDMHARALYRCCQLPTSSIVQGILHSRGMRTQLSTEDVTLCLDARPELTRWKQRFMEDITYAWHWPCEEEKMDECNKRRKHLASRRHSALWMLDADPLQPGEVWLRKDDHKALCDPCTAALESLIHRTRTSLFSKLKSCFDMSRRNLPDGTCSMVE